MTLMVLIGSNKIESGLTNLSKATFINDATHAWNRTRMSIKQCTTYNSAKIKIKEFVKSLPI